VSKKKVLVIVNPQANTGKGRVELQPFLKTLSDSNMGHDVRETTRPKEATLLAQEAIQSKDYWCIVAGGGDGTVNEVASALVDTNMPMLIVPAGRGNDFARSLPELEMPADYIRALSEEGVDVSVDVAMIESLGIFVNSVGIDDFAVTVTKEAHGGELAYLWASLRNLFSYKDQYYEITLDEQSPIGGKFLMIAIMNGRETGGGFKITPSAKINDGLLDVCLIGEMPRKRTRLRCLALARLTGTHDTLKEVVMKQAKKIHIHTLNDSLTLQPDGELVHFPFGDVTITVKHNALRIRTLG